MKIKDKTLIEHFGGNDITKDSFVGWPHVRIDCPNGTDIEEALKILETFSDYISEVEIVVNDNETLKYILSR